MSVPGRAPPERSEGCGGADGEPSLPGSGVIVVTSVFLVGVPGGGRRLFGPVPVRV
ncbi:hypothetical protein GCM10017557_61080 [Streptomyces aurantiacus]|uniref:Uncharacterized protein n=1 Tax=Streptomyces aurantiacus TaxID=47760 RepID=A0A7G1P7K9_9ACTN|nr:hypothetical protein GCM10017557_61080 [Streptomyces aurantiacus]